MKQTIYKVFISLQTLFPFFGICQDEIYFSDGRKEEAHILIVDSQKVHYKKFRDPDGPTFIAEIRKISVIEYADGNYHLFKRSGFLGFAYDTLYVNDNIISFNSVCPLIQRIQISYERIICKGMAGIRVPLYYDYQNDFEFPFAVLGIGWSYYYGGQEKYSLYFSNDILYGLYYNSPNSGNKFSQCYGANLGIGFRANWNQHFAMTSELGGGFLKFNKTIYGIFLPILNCSYRL